VDGQSGRSKAVIKGKRTRSVHISGRQTWDRTINQFCDVWLLATRKAKKTINAYRADLRQFAAWLPQKGCSPDVLKRLDIEAWIANLQAENYESSSIRRKIASLRALFTYIVATKQVPESPFESLRLTLGIRKKLTVVLSSKDLTSMIDVADKRARSSKRGRRKSIKSLMALRDAVILRILSLTGIRVGELVSLHKIDLWERQTTLCVHGKGGRDRTAFIPDKKTQQMIRCYLSMCEAYFPSVPGLLIRSNGAPMTTDAVRQVVKAIAIKAGIVQRVTPHLLRHTAATRFLENGANLRLVQEFLGHGSIRSTERYTHVSSSYLLRILRRAHPLRRVA
jgi:integrase/recombinase XerD